MTSIKNNISPSIILITVMCLGVIITFSHKIELNLVIIICCSLYLMLMNVSIKKIFLTLLTIFPFSLGSWLSFKIFSHSLFYAWLYFFRIYAYWGLGAILTLVYPLKDILLSIHKHFKIPNSFVYGILVSVELLQDVKSQVKKIKLSASMYNESLSWWNPRLYFKFLLSCLRWADIFSNSLILQGFSTSLPRTEYKNEDNISMTQWIGLGVIIGLCIKLAYF